ncbi:FHA domain-containing protein [Bdellovibrio sp. HCB337]|uniref:FHA domain-containing protein n=1 Tax=Bdellovibrio sp. HCB337 TaxID=3394358 RepID=UPI0039A685B7
MWALRVLTGPAAGQTFDLRMGRNLIGRAPNCDVKITSNGVSKEHAEVHVYKEKIMIADLKSSNGTFINGVRVQNGLVRLGDKISVHDVIFDIIPAAEIRPKSSVPSQTVNISLPMNGNAAPQYYPQQYQQGYQQPAPQMMGVVHPTLPEADETPQQLDVPQNFMQEMMARAKDYIERVALPGVYKLPQITEFKYVLGGFIAVFIFMVTLLSMIPMVQITRASILAESQRRAQSIARNVAMANQQLLLQGNISSLSTHSAETEDGVKQVMIIQQSDGMIMAPASRAGVTPDIPFVHMARREMKTQVAQVDSNTIGASFPIGQYDPNTGEPSVKAHAIVLYDIGSLAFDDGHVLSLFFQTLILACLVGLLLFFFMYKLIEYPITTLNEQLDTALREKKDSADVNFQFPALQNLVGNINSLLTRYLNGNTDGAAPMMMVSRDAEAENLVQLMGYPTIAISGEGRIITINANFEQIAHATSGQLNGQPLTAIPDMALQQNIQHLMQKCRDVPGSIHSDQLEFSGHNCQIHCNAMGVENGTIAYFIVSITPVEGGE